MALVFFAVVFFAVFLAVLLAAVFFAPFEGPRGALGEQVHRFRQRHRLGLDAAGTVALVVPSVM